MGFPCAIGSRVKADLLLIHSHYFNMRMWNDWMPQLRDRFRVIRFDMTSHGLTGPDSRGDYTMDRDLQLIEGLLQHLQVESFSVAGSSLGGNMAFHLASRWPDRVQALVLMNSGGLPRSGSRGNRGTVPDWVDAVSYLVPTMAFHSFLEWMIVDDAIVTPQMSREFHAMFRRQGNRVAEFERLRQFEVGDPDPVLEGVIAPTLVMWGEDNPQLPVAQVEKFEARLTSAQTFESIVYPAVGHVLPLEAPGSGSADLRRFLLEHVQ